MNYRSVRRKVSVILLSLSLIISTSVDAFPFASVIRGVTKAAKSAGKSDNIREIPKGSAADEWGSVGGTAKSARYEELRSIVDDLAKKHAEDGHIQSHEDLIRKIEDDLDVISESGYYEGRRLSAENLVLIQQNILSKNFIRKSSRETAERYGLVQKRLGVGAKPHPDRDKVIGWLSNYRDSGMARHEAIRAVERWYRKSPSWHAPSHTTMKRWAREVYR